MPASPRSRELAPSAATSSRAAKARPPRVVDRHRRRLRREVADRVPLDHLDARRAARPLQRRHHRPVEHQVRRGLAVGARRCEGQEHRAHRIAGAAVGDDHLRHRLRRRRDLVPHAERPQQPPSAGRDRRGPPFAYAGARRRGIDQRHLEVRCRAGERQRQRQPDLPAARDHHVAAPRRDCRLAHGFALLDTLSSD